jgi:hypothetical protein
MVAAWSASLLLCLIGLGLSAVNKYRVRRFDPNLEDQQARIAIGRSRAITRAEFEKARQERREKEEKRGQESKGREKWSGAELKPNRAEPDG